MKSILITGASSGIGKALALEASKRGYQVIACARNEDKLNNLKLSAENIQTLVFDVPMKISAEQAARKMLDGLEKGRRNIYFPMIFALFIRLMSKLPDALRVAICKRMKTQ